MQVQRLKIYSLIYGVGIVAFCIYWAANFARHVTFKGDEFLILAQILLALTYIFYLTIQFSIKRINFVLALSIPPEWASACMFAIELLVRWGGHITVHSTVGKGTTFTVIIPVV